MRQASENIDQMPKIDQKAMMYASKNVDETMNLVPNPTFMRINTSHPSFLMLKLLHTRNGVGLLKFDFLARLTRLDICYIGPHDSGQHPKRVHISIHMDCHPVDRKPHENIRWQPILGCMSA